MTWIPASAQTLSPNAQFLSTEFKALSSISNYIGRVKPLHIMLEQSVQGFTAVELKMALRGIARLNPHCPRQAEPITPEMLWAIYFRFKFSSFLVAVYSGLLLFSKKI